MEGKKHLLMLITSCVTENLTSRLGVTLKAGSAWPASGQVSPKPLEHHEKLPIKTNWFSSYTSDIKVNLCLSPAFASPVFSLPEQSVSEL